MLLASCMKDKSVQENILNFKSVHEKLLVLWLLCALAISGMSGYLGYIGGRHAMYDDVSSDWQQCLWEPNYAVLPVEEAAEGNPLIALLQQLGFPVNPQDKVVSLGNFANSLIYVGVIVVLLTLVGHAGIHRSWGQVTWILPSACFGFWCTMLSITYYTASPPLPVPSATTSTLILLLYWIRKRYFDDVNDGDNACGDAYVFLVVFIALCLVMVLSLMMTNIMAFSIEVERYRHHKDSGLNYGNFKGAWLVLLIAVGMMFCYSGAVGGRIVSSMVSVDCFRQFDMTMEEFTHPDNNTTNVGLYYPDIHYPFQPGTANITTLCWAVIFVTVIRAYFNSKPAGLKMVMTTSLLYVLVNTSSMVYVLSLYFQEGLNSDTICFDYFNDESRAAIYGYPDGKQSRMYCQATRVSTFLAFCLYLLNHVMVVVCSYLYYTDKGDDIGQGSLSENFLGGLEETSDYPGVENEKGRRLSLNKSTSSLKSPILA